MLLSLPKDKQPKVVTRQNKTRVAEEKRTVSKRQPKVTMSDEELSLHLLELFSRYKYSLITTEEQLVEFLHKSDRFGIDTETSGLSFYKDVIAGFSIGTTEESAYIPLAHTQGQNYTGSISNLYALLSTKKLDGFNWKFDKHFLITIDSNFAKLRANSDGYLIARLLNNNLDAGLKPLYKHFIDPNVEDYSFSSLFHKAFTEYDPALVYPYAAVDAQKHTILARYLESELQKFPDRYRLYKKLELPLTEVICSMEEHGIQLDRNRIYELNKELTTQGEQILSEIRQIAGNDNFNPGSSKQVGDILVDLGLLQRGANGKVSTGEAILEEIKDLHPLPHMILDYRGVTKLSSTYTTGLLEFADSDAVAHPIFSQCGTDTGRMSSQRFNAQNIPKDNRFRNLFIPKPGNKLISVDYSQQEVRILAALAQDQAMIEAFRSGRDFYAVMASIVFNLPYEQCTKKGEHAEYRGHMKSIVLGLNYDMGIPSLAKNLGKTEHEAAEIYSKFQTTCPTIDVFKKKCKDFAYAHGYQETVLKRRRYFDGVGYKVLGLPRFECWGEDTALVQQVLETAKKLDKDRRAIKRLQEEAKRDGITLKDREAVAFSEERQCTNSVIQGSAADATKLAMVSFANDRRAGELDAHIVLQIHDEIIIECPEQNAEEAGQLLADIMNGVSEELFDIPGGGEACIMSRWEKDA